MIIGDLKNGIVQLPSPNEKSLYTETKLILQQFTGLKDKNGVEIYEGDILKIEKYKKSDLFDDKIIGYIFNSDIEWFINYNKNAFVLKAENYLKNENYFNIEVIGNIYQNPELLNNQI